MRYAIIQYTTDLRYDMIDYKRRRISAVEQKTYHRLINFYLNGSPTGFWYYPHKDLYPTITKYLYAGKKFKILHKFNSIAQLQSEFPEYFI